MGARQPSGCAASALPVLAVAIVPPSSLRGRSDAALWESIDAASRAWHHPIGMTARPVAARAILCGRMARRLAITWVFNTIALFVATWLLSGLSYGHDWWALLLAALVFTLANVYLKPLLTILSIPFIVVTLGIFYFLINVFMLYLTHWIVSSFTIASFWWAALAAIIVSAVNGVLNRTVGRPGDDRRRIEVRVIDPS